MSGGRLKQTQFTFYIPPDDVVDILKTYGWGGVRVFFTHTFVNANKIQYLFSH